MENDKLKRLKFEKDKHFHLNQANHNYIFCYNVFDVSKTKENIEQQFFDWAITASFYSSLHYVRCSLSIDKEFIFYKKHFKNQFFDDARIDRKTKPSSYPKDAASSRHEILKRIVQETYPQVSSDYNTLLDRSMNSRYYQFKNATQEECELVLELLGNI